eukprot:gene11222-12519_t
MTTPPLATISLSGNRLSLSEDGKWRLQSSDLDQALLEMETLLTEKEDLANSLSLALTQCEDLRSEIRDLNHLKTVLLEMLMKERQQRIEVESMLEGCKEELRESYRTIVDLRKQLPHRE